MLKFHHIASVEAENRKMREALTMQSAWVSHWLDDIAADLKPTRESLDAAQRQLNAALREERVS